MAKRERTTEIAAQQAEYHRQWYAKNQIRHKENAAKARVKNRERNRVYIREYKSVRKCLYCPENHPACLDFHHRDEDDKYDNVATLAATARGLKKLKNEIDKCDLVCRNCHAKLHHAKKMEII